MKHPYTAEKINHGRMREDPDQTSPTVGSEKMNPINKTDNSVNTLGRYLTPSQVAKKHKKKKKKNYYR